MPNINRNHLCSPYVRGSIIINLKLDCSPINRFKTFTCLHEAVTYWFQGMDANLMLCIAARNKHVRACTCLQGVGSGFADPLHQGGDRPRGHGVHSGRPQKWPNLQDLCQQPIPQPPAQAAGCNTLP